MPRTAAMTDEGFEFLKRDIDRAHERHSTAEGRLSKVESELTDVKVGLAKLHSDVQNTNRELVTLNVRLSEIKQDTASLVSLDKGYKAWRGPIMAVGGTIFFLSVAVLTTILYFVEVYGPGFLTK